LAGLHAVVTGASSGIGRAIAETYAAEGAAVLLTHRDSPERAREVADAIAARGGRALVRQADLATRHACERLVAEARDELGRVEVWVNNAGADVLTGPAAAWGWERKLDTLLAVDLKGTIACSYAIGDVMRGQDRGGWIETAFGEEVDREFHRSIAEDTPLGRWGRPHDVADAALYLASPAAAFVTGQAINVNGGVVM
jgi:3-oxoacyl-[acyl-carrier protein] reductase